MVAGRPSIMTPEIIEKLEEAFMDGLSDEESCLVADICPSTLYNYQKANPKFVERKKLLRNHPTMRAKRLVIADIDAKNVDTAKWYLERKAKHEFSTKTTIDVRTSELSDDELDREIAELQRDVLNVSESGQES